MHLTGADRLVLARWLPVAVPAGIMGLALAYESMEHVFVLVSGQVNYVFELLFFGVAGPLVVFASLAYMQRTLRGRVEAEARTAALNRDLERQVAERTAHLEAAQAELRGQAERLGAMNEDLRRLDDLKSEFVSLVSHELRRPLTNISGGIELISQDAAQLPPAANRTLQILATESARLRALVESILDVSRLEAGHLQLTCGPVFVEPLLDRCLASVCGPDRPVRVGSETPGRLPPAWADEVYFEEVLRNVLTNAVKYSPPGDPIHIDLGLGGGCVAIAVTNSGPTIPADDQRFLFDAFYRGPGREGRVPGYGLGLYFARKLIDAQGGSIGVRSPVFDDAAAGGARFTITVPVARAEAEA